MTQRHIDADTVDFEYAKRRIDEVRNWLQDSRIDDHQREPDSDENHMIDALYAATRYITAMQADIDKFRNQLAEARREICELVAMSSKITPAKYAEKRGWDCFKEDGK